MHTVVYLLKKNMIPSKEILVQYRHGPTRSDTLVTLLFKGRARPKGLYWTPDSNEVEILKEICERIGVDVIRELARLECELEDPNAPVDSEQKKRTTFPLALACQHWPLAAIGYLVETLQIEGSVPETVAHQKVLECCKDREEVLRWFQSLVELKKDR